MKMLLHNLFLPNVSFVTSYVLVDLSFTLYMYHRGWGMKIYCKKNVEHMRLLLSSIITHISQIYLRQDQRYTYRVLQTIHMKLILVCVWAERALLGSAKTAMKLK